jgi:hypothetical protein
MEDFLTRSLQQLLARPDGPLHLRFILQPITASVIAIRAGIRDSRHHQPPYLATVFSRPDLHGALLRSAWRDIGKVLIIAVILDAAYQLIELRWLYPGQCLIVAIVLAIVPYVLIRGPASRLSTQLRTRRARSKIPRPSPQQ